MIKIYSKKYPKKLLHVIWKFGEGNIGGNNFMIPDDEFIQVAAGVYPPKGHNFGGPHRHLPQERHTNGTQETFIVIKGSVEITLYDLDDTFLEKQILNAGDCYIYLWGGHGFKILTDDTFFYEIKNGPYYGKEKDKEYLNAEEN